MPVGSSIGSGVGGLLGGIAVLGGAAGEGGGDEYKEALKVIKQLQVSDFDYRSLTAPQLRILAHYSPTLYDAVVPPEAQRIIESPEMRDSQVKSLGTLEQVRDEGDTVLDRLQTDRANREILGSANAADEAVLRNLAARGQLSGGDELQARLGQSQGAQNAAADLASDLAEQRALRRISGAQSAAGVAGNIRGADVDVARANADYMTNFNNVLAQMRTQAARDNAQAQTQAQAGNTQNRQNIANQNALIGYDVAKSNLDRQNELKHTAYGERLAKATALAGAYNTYGGYKDQEKQQKADAIVGVGQGAGGLAGSLFGF